MTLGQVENNLEMHKKGFGRLGYLGICPFTWDNFAVTYIASRGQGGARQYFDSRLDEEN